MSKSIGGSGNILKVATIVLGVLVVAAIVVIAVMASQKSTTDKQLKDSQQQVTSLQAQVSGLQTNLSSTQSQLSAAQAKAVTDLAAAKAASDAQIAALQKNASSLQSTIDAQAAKIKTMTYPRHFASVDELTTWLQKDDTNTLYPNPTAVQKAQMAFILQVKAARDGYLMTVNIPLGGGLDLITNRAIVGDIVYEVRASDDFVQRWGSISPALPPYPISPDSGK